MASNLRFFKLPVVFYINLFMDPLEMAWKCWWEIEMFIVHVNERMNDSA